MSAQRIEQLAEGVVLICGDCREVLPTLGKVDAVVTDPPYGINSTRAMVDEAQARKFRAIKAEQSARREAEREAASLAYHQQKEQRRIARERKRVEMQAAYELVRELGLLDQIQRDQKEETDETRTTH